MIKNKAPLIICSLLLLWIFYNIFSASRSPESVPYSLFLQSEDIVNTLVLEADGRSFVFSVADGEIFRSTFPTELAADRVINDFVASGKTIDIESPPKDSWVVTFLITLVPVLLLVGVLIWLHKKMGTGMSTFTRNPAHLIDPKTNPVTLGDVASNPGDFDDIHEIIDFLKSPAKYHAANAKLPHGVLMYGPPGVGKTLLAKAIAGEAKVPFFSISGADFVEMFVGVGASRVRHMFEAVRAAQPAILFIDEIDAVGAKRSAGTRGGGTREADQTLNQLLTEMDGFASTNDSILIIGATNRPDALDPALLREGRFDRKIAISLPDVNAREKILEVHTRQHRLADDVSLRVIARGTPGLSGAALNNLVNEAAMIIAKDSRTQITMKDLDKARDKVFMGKERSFVMNDQEKRLTAYHEAGHAIAAFLTPEHDPLYKMTIIPRDRALGLTMYLPEEDKYSISYKKLRSNLVSLMGGRAAEEIQFGLENVSTGASSDLEQATDIARNMITRWGFGKQLGLVNHDLSGEKTFMISDTTKEAIDAEIKELLDEVYMEAKRHIENNRGWLDRVASALIDKETIDVEMFKALRTTVEGE